MDFRSSYEIEEYVKQGEQLSDVQLNEAFDAAIKGEAAWHKEGFNDDRCFSWIVARMIVRFRERLDSNKVKKAFNHIYMKHPQFLEGICTAHPDLKASSLTVAGTPVYDAVDSLTSGSGLRRRQTSLDCFRQNHGVDSTRESVLEEVRQKACAEEIKEN